MRNVFHRLALILLLGVSCRADLTLRYTVEANVGSGLPPALAQPLQQQLAASIPREKLLRVKGDKTASRLGTLTAIIDNSNSTITLLNPATKQYAQFSMDEYIATLQAKITPAAAESLKKVKFDVESSKTGQFGMVSGIRAEEHVIAITVSVDLPGAPAGPVIRMDMHTWLASPDELNRIPALRQYSANVQRAFSVFDPANAVDKLFMQVPGMADKLRALTDEAAKNVGSLALKTQSLIYGPKGDAGAPIFSMTTELAEISTDAIDDSVFEAPPEFQKAAAAEVIKAAMPAPGSRPVIPGEPIFKVGGGVSAPALISKRNPVYTKEALQAKLEGSVTLSVVVDKEGSPKNVRVVRSLGLGLDEKAIEAVSQWKFRPGQKDSQPVSAMANIQVSFKLLDRPQQQ